MSFQVPVTQGTLNISLQRRLYSNHLVLRQLMISSMAVSLRRKVTFLCDTKQKLPRESALVSSCPFCSLLLSHPANQMDVAWPVGETWMRFTDRT